VSIEGRRQRERQQRRAEILAAATRVFAQAGIDGASMGAVAREAELGKATLYYYFPTKEALYAAVLDEGTEAFFGSLALAPPEGDDLVATVEALLRGYLAFFRAQPELHRVLAPRLVHTIGASWTSGANPHPAQAAPPAHAAFMGRLMGQAMTSPWLQDPRALGAFLADVLIALSQRILAGQGQLDAALEFYLGVVRRPPFASVVRP